MNPLHVISLCAACASVAFAEQEVNLEAFTSKGQMMYSDTSRGFAKAKNPAVVRFKGNYFMYYTVKQNREVRGLRIGIAASDDLLI